MAEDNKLPEENEEIKEAESKDWQWDAAAPTVDDDFLDLDRLIPDDETDETNESDEADQAEEADEADEPDNDEDDIASIEEPEEIIIEEPEDEDEDLPEGEGARNTEDGCCIICGKKIKNSESELYCNECRTKYMKVDYGASHIILSVLMIFVAVAAIVAYTATSRIASAIKTGDDYYAKNQFSNALDGYNNVQTVTDGLNDGLNAFLQGISTNFGQVKLFDAGENIYKKTAEIKVRQMTVSYEDREDFIDLVDTHFSQKELAKEENKGIKDCYDFCKKLDNTTNEVYKIWYPLIEQIGDAMDENGKLTGDYPTNKEIFAELDDYVSKHPDAELSIIDCFKFYTLSYEQNQGIKVDEKELVGYLSSAYEKAGTYGYIYAEPYLAYSFDTEDYDTIDKIAAEVIKVDPSNDSAYYYSAMSAVGKKDYDKALNICEELKKVAPDSLEYYIIKAQTLRLKQDFDAAIDVCAEGLKAGSDVELIRQQAIAYMLAGEKEKALDAAKKVFDEAYAAAYTNQNVSLEAINTSALIAYLCGDEDTYNKIKELLTSNSKYDLEDSVYEVIKGEKEFKDIFLSGKGDI